MVERRDDGAMHRLRRLALWSLSLLLVLELLAGVLAPDGAIAREHGKRKPGRTDVSGQIVGGTAVPEDTYPFMALIEFDFDGDTYYCGGSLINATHVLTAAHCATDDDGRALRASTFTVYLGMTDRTGITNCPLCTFEVSDVAVHPGYSAETTTFDVALLELDAPVPSQLAQPIPLVGNDAGPFDDANRPLRVSGWGVTKQTHWSGPRLLRAATVKVVADPRCANAYQDDFMPSTMLCAAARGKDSCYGDSGGPLFAAEATKWEKKVVKQKARKHRRDGKKGNKKKKLKWVPVAFVYHQIGIVSWGEGCAKRGFPGVYTRLTNSSIQSFIQRND